MTDRWSTRLSVAVLALLAYVPALASSPGRMPADTKLYLALEPGALIGRAASTFEAEQFAGWVPHQQITYLWPSGPWFWLFDVGGVPDWIAHRLWIGTILFAAGTGARWLAQHLSLGPAAALVAGIVYQTSPYILAYVSRTSLLLLPWAALGWIVAFTVRATRLRPEVAGHRRWFEPAAIALIVATVGSANATALVLIAPAPVLWVLHSVARRPEQWKELAAFAARTAALCVATSLWWAAMLVVQARHGAPVLAYSETLADVSRSSTGPEVLRGLGYWLFYVRDSFAPTTSASFAYLTSGRVIAVSYAVTLVGLAGIASATWRDRSFAAWLAVVGVVLAVGVHPIGSPSPMMSVLVGDDESGLALALRSSTRAAPMFVLAIALGAGAFATSVAGRVSRPQWRPAVAIAVGVLAIVNLPALWQADLVDPAIDRDERVPAAWTAAAADLDQRATGFRVIQLPGAEFGAFDWGYTVDQPLVALTDRPVVTRDLLPLGSAAAMDLLYAFDDRIQGGTLEPAAVAPISRLFGADTVWLANDLDSLRFRTPAPSTVDALLTAEDVAGLGPVARYGAPTVPDAAGPLVDAAAFHADRGVALAPVALVTVEAPVPIVRAKAESVIVSGSGDGIVDAASAGLLTGQELVRYSASLERAELATAVADGTALIVTDSNRDRAHHWRTSQDVVGHTEPGGPGIDVLVPTAADQRLNVFPGSTSDQQTVAVQDGPVTAIASGYGEPFAYRPEDRAVMAIDGDLRTAWRVGDHADPVGERIRLVADDASETLTLHQVPPAPGGRQIDAVTVAVGDRAPERVALDERSVDGQGQPVAIAAAPGASIDIMIESVTLGDQARLASRSGVGFRELDLGLGPTTELIRPPRDLLTFADVTETAPPIDVVLSRLRVAATDPWRSDPEPEVQRLLPLEAAIDFNLTTTLRLDAGASDAVVNVALGTPDAAVADRHLAGSLAHRGAAAIDGDDTTAWLTPFDDIVGSTLTVPLVGSVDGLVVVQPFGAYSPITALHVRADDGEIVVAAVPPPDAAGRSSVELPAPLSGATLTLTIAAIDERTAVERRYGDRIVLPAGIAELSATAGLDVRPVDRTLPVERECSTGSLLVDGEPQALRFSTTVGALLDGEPVIADRCDGALSLDAGAHEIRSVGRAETGFTVDRVVLRAATETRSPIESTATVDVLIDAPRHRRVAVSCPDGCWFVLGEGYNSAWDAEGLGAPQLVDGGFNGWWIEPTAATRVVDVRWSAQRPVTVGLALSALAAAACVALVAIGWRSRQVTPCGSAVVAAGEPSPVVTALVLAIVAFAVIGPVWALAALAAVVVQQASSALARRVARPGVAALGRLETLGVVGVVAVAVSVIWIERREQPFPGAGWTMIVDHLNGLAVFSVLLVATGVTDATARLSGLVSARRGTDSRTAADAT